MVRRDQSNVIDVVPAEKPIPCPFCKNEDIVVGTIHHPDGNEAKYAFCINCGASGPRKWTNKSEADAIRAWNRRAA